MPGLQDFNDTSREFFENTGDRLLGKRQERQAPPFRCGDNSNCQEPWLLDRQTMKYDEMLPTLVLDLDKVPACSHSLCILDFSKPDVGDPSPSS